ncbi:MAG: hypothetical protein M3Z64_04390 [Verrucomicrobiota bacterium]|nr:hypothetical protein [Verrucomicrobiota bacterium]
MSVSHREEQRGDRLLDVLTNEAAGLRIIVSRLGAELISLARRNPAGDWVGFLHRDNELAPPPSGWGNHATVMGYFLHRLKDGRSLYRGHEIRGATHSFLRTKVWSRLESAQAGTLSYRMTPQEFSPTDYPLNVSLGLTYRLDGGQLVVSFLFTNEEPLLSAHVGFGLHPGFAAHSLETCHLEMPSGTFRRHFSPGNYLTPETEVIRFPGGEMPFPKEKLPGSYILEFLDVPNRIFTFSDPPSGRAVSLDLTGVPYVTLWSDGGSFLCIEPCWGLTDHHEQRAFEDKAGIQRILPRGLLEASCIMRPELT